MLDVFSSWSNNSFGVFKSRFSILKALKTCDLKVLEKGLNVVWTKVYVPGILKKRHTYFYPWRGHV